MEFFEKGEKMNENKNIQSKSACTLGNKKHKPAMKNKKWTKAELNFLRVNYKRMTAREISEKLNRPIQAVYGRVKLEKIHKIKVSKRRVSINPPVVEKTTQELLKVKANEASVKSTNFIGISALILAVLSMALHFIH